jgi:hypothetical protein
MNRDGQMLQIHYTEYPHFATRFKSVAYHDGLPAAAKWVREGILAKYEAQKKAPAKKEAVKRSAGKKSAAKPKSAGKPKRK